MRTRNGKSPLSPNHDQKPLALRTTQTQRQGTRLQAQLQGQQQKGTIQEFKFADKEGKNEFIKKHFKGFCFEGFGKLFRKIFADF
jgi:hypothetical protein